MAFSSHVAPDFQSEAHQAPRLGAAIGRHYLMVQNCRWLHATIWLHANLNRHACPSRHTANFKLATQLGMKGAVNSARHNLRRPYLEGAIRLLEPLLLVVRICAQVTLQDRGSCSTSQQCLNQIPP